MTRLLPLAVSALVCLLTAKGFADSTGPTVKRRADATEEDLRKQLLAIKDVGLTQTDARRLYAQVEAYAKKKAGIRPDCGAEFYERFVSKRWFAAIPWKKEADATMGQEDAQTLHSLSIGLRESLMASTTRTDVRPDADKVRESLSGGKAGRKDTGIKADEWKKPQAIPTLMQLMQAENAPIRMLLIELLSDIPGKEASAALAQRALFDLSPDVRAKAVQALSKRQAPEYAPTLLDGLRHPWPPAADHAAEAIVALELNAYVPDLVKLLREPDPQLPFKADGMTVIKELVRVNHLSNCMLCHAPSLSTSQLLRGRVPSPGESPPPVYYRESRGTFIRADVTYLRQEFSVMQSVPNPDKWPSIQRYDYFVWTRPATDTESRMTGHSAPRTDLPESKAKPKAGRYAQEGAVLFALRELVGSDAGTTYDQWSALLKSRKR